MADRKNLPFQEKNNALEGAFYSLKKRLKTLDELYQQYCWLTPHKLKPFVKSFNSIRDYEAWKRKQKNPWYW